LNEGRVLAPTAVVWSLPRTKKNLPGCLVIERAEPDPPVNLLPPLPPPAPSDLEERVVALEEQVSVHDDLIASLMGLPNSGVDPDEVAS
jgi:hypothetical protein